MPISFPSNGVRTTNELIRIAGDALDNKSQPSCRTTSKFSYSQTRGWAIRSPAVSRWSVPSSTMSVTHHPVQSHINATVLVLTCSPFGLIVSYGGYQALPLGGLVNSDTKHERANTPTTIQSQHHTVYRTDSHAGRSYPSIYAGSLGRTARVPCVPDGGASAG
jgi:hypothetical protein